MVEEKWILGEVCQAHQAYSERDAGALVFLNPEAFMPGDVAFEDHECVMTEEDGARGCGNHTGDNLPVRVMPPGHVGEVDIAEVDAADVVGVAVGVEERCAVYAGKEDEFGCGDYVPVEISAEVCLEWVDADVGRLAGEGMLGGTVCLKPEDVCLDTGGETYAADGLCDDVPAELSVGAAALECVDDLVLGIIQSERDDVVGIVDVTDIVFAGCPECEIEMVSQFIESTAGGIDGCCVEDFQERLAFDDSLDLREVFHL